MKKLIATAVLGVALSGCNQAAENSDEPTVAEAPAAVETVASMAGTYEYEMEGAKVTAVLNTDGTYADTVDGEVTEAGTWTETHGKTCFDPEGEAGETCFTSTEPDAEGMFTATSDDGETTLTIRKVG